MTDFGSDPYIGIMKGRILQINPKVRIISLTNHIKIHDIRHGAFILLKSYKHFPLHTIFLVVVDPGVGSPRKTIAAQIGDYYFIGSDNGILSPILSDNALDKPLGPFWHLLRHVKDIDLGTDVVSYAYCIAERMACIG